MTPPSGATAREPSTRMKVVMIALLTFAALNLMRLAYINDSRLKVPPVLGYVLGVTLLFAAAAVMMKLRGREPKEWMALAILLGLTGMCGWVAFTEPAACRAMSTLFLPRASCRAGFGLGAALLLLMVGMLVHGWWRRVRSAAERRPAPDAGAGVATNAP